MKPQCLYPPRQSLVRAFLIPPPIQLLLIPQRRVRPSRPPLLRHRLRDLHVIQAILLDRLVIKPRTIARLPLRATDHAEFCAAAAGHVVTALLELDRRGAVETPLPALFLRDLGEASGCFVLWAVATCVPPSVASAANFCAAAAAFPVFTPAGRAPGGVEVDVGRLDPLAAAAGGAVDAILGGVFLVLLIPLHFETEIEKFVDMFQGDVVGGAAFGRHVLRVGDGEGEDAAEARVAHAVGAGEFGGSGDRDVGEAG